ncbi:basic 7S globulin [Prunus yedoensis var. nudiflora]|uniref:Basic 7S globulin n=1 Tax=Prunus yedoensis var. nudiflora TaxID=2094558 RepID=A0A314YLT9_PRUYE|nr:basic 7S globulin [Prunus yedoensis var. nudiflora]
MASSSIHSLLLFCSLLLSIHMIPSSQAKPSSLKPKALVLPIAKDASTLQYITTIKQRTPPVTLKLTVDLGGQFLWVDCDEGQYISSTYKPAYCNATQCSIANSKECNWECFFPKRPGCNNRTCILFPDNTVIGSADNNGEVGQDILWGLHSTDGSHPGPKASNIPNFIFACSSNTFYGVFGLANGVKGMAGLGRTRIALPTQFASAYKLPRKFAICLPSSARSYGVVFFGDGPYVLAPKIDVYKSLTFTKLILNPVSTGNAFDPDEPSAEYFINVKSIKVNEKIVSLNTSLLAIDQNGYGGTKISTVNPYTVFESTIYKAVVDAFVKEMPGHIKRVASVEPFGACFDSTYIGMTRVGPAVPSIDFVLQSEGVYWRVSGANSMVQVSKDVLCLGFAGAEQRQRYSFESPTTSIVIGGHQLEDNLLQFDLDNKRLGFSSSLLSRETSCANFNFTSTAVI